MIALILEDFRDWRISQMGRTVTMACLAVLAAGAATLLQPVIVLETATLVSILLGWSRGSQYYMGSSSRRPLIDCAVGPIAAASAKAVSSFGVWLVHILVLSPVLALTAASRGLRLEALAACALAWLAAYYSALGLSFFASLVFARADGIIGLFLVLLWLGSAALCPPLREANPFILAWDALKARSGPADWLGLGGLLAFAAAAFAASALALGRIRKSLRA
jgi:hypothetical protein